jgi:hypothetical protein
MGLLPPSPAGGLSQVVAASHHQKISEHIFRNRARKKKPLPSKGLFCLSSAQQTWGWFFSLTRALPLIGQDHGHWKGNSFHCGLKRTKSIVRKESHIQSKDHLRRKLGNSKEWISEGGFFTACWKQWRIQLSQCIWDILEKVLSEFQTHVTIKNLLWIIF